MQGRSISALGLKIRSSKYSLAGALLVAFPEEKLYQGTVSAC